MGGEGRGADTCRLVGIDLVSQEEIDRQKKMQEGMFYMYTVK